MVRVRFTDPFRNRFPGIQLDLRLGYFALELRHTYLTPTWNILQLFNAGYVKNQSDGNLTFLG